MQATDEELVQRLTTDGGEDAVRTLYDANAHELFGFALRRLGDRELAEELVQDVFTSVWRHADQFDPRRATFRTWLFGIARHAIIDAERRRAARPQPASGRTATAQPGSDEPIEQAVARWEVQSALARLTPEHRQVIALAHFEGMTLREIAEHTRVPLGTVKSRTYYALRSLRLVLEEMGFTL